jgi:hypothetical protein
VIDIWIVSEGSDMLILCRITVGLEGKKSDIVGDSSQAGNVRSCSYSPGLS